MFHPKEGTARAIEAMGSAAKLGRAVGLSPQSVTHWRVHGIPLNRVRDVAQVTGIPVHHLHPDFAAEAGPEEPAQAPTPAPPAPPQQDGALLHLRNILDALEGEEDAVLSSIRMPFDPATGTYRSGRKHLVQYLRDLRAALAAKGATS